MKIVFNTTYREKMGGGAGRVCYEIVAAFAKKHQVLFIKPGKLTRLRREAKNLDVLELCSKGKNEITLPILDRKNIGRVFKALKAFSPDIIHTQDTAPLSLLLQIWAKEHHVPFINTSHVLPTKLLDFDAKELSKYWSGFLDSVIVKKYLLSFFNDCEGIIALNESARKDIRKFGYSGKIFIVPNGRNLRVYNQLKLPRISEATKKLIFIGHLTPRKNQKFLLEVMRYLPENFELVLVGKDLQEGYLQELKAYAQRIGVKNVVFTGEVDYEKTPQYLKASHVFVSASRMEVQSLVILEALAAGKPVVGLSNETIDEFVDETVGFNFPKSVSSKKFASKIEEICTLSQDKYEQMCLQARDKVAHLDWKNVVLLMTDVYKDCLKNSVRKKDIKKKDTNDVLEKLFEKINLKNVLPQKQLELKNDLNLFSIILLTSLGGSFYSLLETSKSLKRYPLNYLSKTAKKLLSQKHKTRNFQKSKPQGL